MPAREEYNVVLTARDQTAAAFNNLKNNLRGIDALARGISVATGGLITGLSVGALAAFVAKSVDAAAGIGLLAKRVGLTTDELQGLQKAVKDGGGALDQAEKAAHRFADALGDAARRQGPLYDFLIRNNVAIARNVDG